MNIELLTSCVEQSWYGKRSRMPFPVHELMLLSSGGWRIATAIHDACSRHRSVRSTTVGISSLTVGGGGKTPLVRWLADALHHRGIRPVVVSRGYGGTIRAPMRVRPGDHTAGDVGDEPILLARRLPSDVPVIVSRNRYEGCVFADTTFRPDCLILDDTVMQTSVKLDVELLVQGTDGGIGNGRCLPAGPLRRPVKTVRRMDCVVRINEDAPNGRGDRIKPVPTFDLPVFDARIIPVDIRCDDGTPVPLSLIRNRRVGAWAGLARPWRFKNLLRRLGADVVFYRSFADHHVYTEEDVSTLRRRIQDMQLLPITTEKDIVRFPSQTGFKPYTVDVMLQFDDPDAFVALITRAMEQS